MWHEIQVVFAQSFERMSSSLAGLLPSLVAMLLITAGALVVAWLARLVLRRFLEKVGLDRRARQWGVAGVSPGGMKSNPATVLAGAVYWLIVVLGLVAALDALSVGGASSLALRVLSYLPQVLVAALVFLAGVVAAGIFERNVLISAVNMQIQSARLLSLGVKWLVLVLATAMSLEHLGIGGSIVTVFFAILFGGIVLALALAVGLGSQELVSRSLEKRLDHERSPDPPGRGVDHL